MLFFAMGLSTFFLIFLLGAHHAFFCLGQPFPYFFTWRNHASVCFGASLFLIFVLGMHHALFGNWRPAFSLFLA
jgi:hypothetical protein